MSASPAAVVELARELSSRASGIGRLDLGGALGRGADRLADPQRQVLVVGEYKAGKSSLVNGLLNVDLCPVDIDEATAVATVFGHGRTARAGVARTDEDGSIRVQRIAFDQLAEAVLHPLALPGPPVEWVQISLPRALLASGMVLVDTPGVGGLDGAAAALNLAAAPSAAAVVFVVEGTREITASELDHLRALRAVCADVVVAPAKIDLTAQWRHLAELIQARLADAGLDDVTVLPTSAVLRRVGLEREDKALNDRSGYPSLVSWLRRAVANGADLNAATAELLAVCGELERWCRDEREALRSDLAALDRSEELVAAQTRLAERRGAAAGWQQTLADEAAALTSDADHDLRTRVRTLGQEIDDAVEAVDPATVWEELRHHVSRRIGEEIAGHRSFVEQRSAAMVERVARHFAGAQATAAPLFTTPLDEIVPEIATVTMPRANPAGAVMTAMRGSYGGVLMFGMVSGLAGLSMINPITVVAGVGLGRKALRDERQRLLTQRRFQAKTAARKAVDEVSHAESKRSRDAVRNVHRDLRAEFGALADEVVRSMDAVVAQAQAAVRAGEAARAARGKELDEALRVIAALRARIQRPKP